MKRRIAAAVSSAALTAAVLIGLAVMVTADSAAGLWGVFGWMWRAAAALGFAGVLFCLGGALSVYANAAEPCAAAEKRETRREDTKTEEYQR